MNAPSPADDLIAKLSDDGRPLGAVAFGGLAACVGAFPIASLTAAVYRFPVPFAGYLSGFEGAGAALFATFFYGMLGGFVVLGATGMAAGWLAQACLRSRTPPVRLLTLAIVAVVDVVYMVALANLDKVIGPW